MNKELLLVIEAVSNEKSVPKESIFTALEQAVALALKKKLYKEAELQVQCDRKSGQFEAFRCFKVVREVQDEQLEVSEESSGLPAGSIFKAHIAAQGFDRITTQVAKQVIIQKIRLAERLSCVQQFQHYLNKMVSGVAKEVSKDWVMVDLGWKSEAMLHRSRMLPKENFRVGDRVRAVLTSAQWENPGPLFQLSRQCNEMLLELLRVEVPEISEGVVEIKGIARDPGVRSKLAVLSKDKRIDPIGACVGMRGSRIQSVSSELKGERLDIVIWDENPVQYVIHAMAPTSVVSMIMDEDALCMDVAVPEAELSQAIGKNGQNVKLASQLTGWRLNVLGENEFLNQKSQEHLKLRHALTKALEIELSVADLLIEEGWSTVQEIADLTPEDCSDIANLEATCLMELRDRAQAYLKERQKFPWKALADELSQLEDGSSFELQESDFKALTAQGISSLEQIAEADKGELLPLLHLDDAACGRLIMAARRHCWSLDESEKQ